MANLNALPAEVLHDIISHLSPNFVDLLTCSLVCRALWNVATATLYGHIDLDIDARYDEEAKEKTKRRQLRLLRSLAENPKLGSLVRTFKNYRVTIFAEARDATLDDGSDMVINAAKNMKSLSRAFLTPNPLATHIIANLPSYSQLIDLHVYGLVPEVNIWGMAPVSLTSLKLEVITPWGRREDPWDTAQLLVNVVEATCPSLESLDISFCEMRGAPPTLPIVPPERAQQYREVQATTTTKLTHLQHFGYNPGEQSAIEVSFLEFVSRHRQSLKSIVIPISCGPWTREKLQFILKVCDLLPSLDNLTLAQTQTAEYGETMSCLSFFHALTTALASPKYSIERFSAADIGMSFTPEIGQLFAFWKSLKFLRIGDADHNSGHSPYADDRHLNFEAYRTAILGFIKQLPPSLEELYLEVNGEGLCCYEDSDFDPICNLGTPIFDSLRRLYTCDIHAWISNIDGGLGELPEKGVFYRRLPCQGNKIKNVWTSRMDSVYQGSDPIVTTQCVEVELEDHEGVFEGRDAEEVWLDGFEIDRRMGLMGRGLSRDKRDFSWPFWRDPVRTYEMFRKRN